MLQWEAEQKVKSITKYRSHMYTPSFQVLKSGEKLLHGSLLPPQELNDSMMYLTSEHRVAEMYAERSTPLLLEKRVFAKSKSKVYTFTLKNDLSLFDLSDVRNIDFLLHHEDYKDLAEEIFVIDDEGVYRHSAYGKDEQLFSKMCENMNLDGLVFSSPDIRKKIDYGEKKNYFTAHHQEYILCKARSSLTFELDFTPITLPYYSERLTTRIPKNTVLFPMYDKEGTELPLFTTFEGAIAIVQNVPICKSKDMKNIYTTSKDISVKILQNSDFFDTYDIDDSKIQLPLVVKEGVDETYAREMKQEVIDIITQYGSDELPYPYFPEFYITRKAHMQYLKSIYAREYDAVAWYTHGKAMMYIFSNANYTLNDYFTSLKPYSPENFEVYDKEKHGEAVELDNVYQRSDLPASVHAALVKSVIYWPRLTSNYLFIRKQSKANNTMDMLP